MKQPRNLAHRGASGYAPENTVAAFRLALEMGSDGLELDVQLTKDGVPVVIHDEMLVRTTGAPGMVWDYTWNQLRELDAGSWMGAKWDKLKIPSLEEVLSEFAGVFLNIELKNSIATYDGLEEKVISLVNQYCGPSHVILSSFNPYSVLKIIKMAPEIPAGFLFSEPTNDLLDVIWNSGARAVHPDFQTLSAETFHHYREHGLEVNTWTVNSEEEMKQAIDFGVNSIITNYPDRLHKILQGK